MDTLTGEPLRSGKIPSVTSFEVGEPHGGMAAGSVGWTTKVPFTVIDGDQRTDEVAVLERDDGAWKVCDIQPD